MSTPEAESAQRIDFMSVGEYVDLVNKNIAATIKDQNVSRDGAYVKLIDHESLISSPDYHPEYVIKIPDRSDADCAIIFLRQAEWIRRELIYGVEATMGDGLERVFQEAEIEMAATRFYEYNGDIVDPMVEGLTIED